jgi:hypothetical protein
VWKSAVTCFKYQVYLYGLGTISPSNCAGILKQSVGARNQVGIGLSYRPARLHSLADLFLVIDSGLLKRLKIRAQRLHSLADWFLGIDLGLLKSLKIQAHAPPPL